MLVKTRHNLNNGDGVDLEVRSSGTDYLCIEIQHPKSGYCDRALIKKEGSNKDSRQAQKAKIERVKTSLLTTFQVAYAAGSHYEQKHNRGDTRLGCCSKSVSEE